MRYLSLLPMTALVLATPMSAPAPALAVQPPRADRAAAEDPDELCRPFMEQFRANHDDRVGFGRGRPTGRNGAQPQMAPPPMPMPPPAPPPPPTPPPPQSRTMPDGTVAPFVNVAPVAPVENRERYAGEPVATVQSVAETPVSTFSIDVDTGSYANVRRMLNQRRMPPQAAVRTEEMLNYFRYDYPAPRDRSQPFSVSSDMTTTPWNGETRLLRIGLRGYDLQRSERPAANLVFLVDVSGSMDTPDRH